MPVQQIDSAIDSVNAASSRVPLDARHHELAQRVARLHCNDGVHRTAFAPLALLRASNTSQRLPAVYTPSLCVVVQGSKCARLGKQAFHYDAFNYLIVSVTLPVLGQILVASPERPYLCIRIDIDVREISRLLLDMEAVADVGGEPMQPALFVAQMPTELVDAILRLIRLLDAPADLPMLGPLVLREIWYRVLRSEMGHRMRQLIEPEGPVQRIHRAIELLQQRYSETLRIEELAEAAHMSLSTFHARFKAVTSLSPLQFQKQLRLQEARRLMMSDRLDATTAGYNVGYESASQFSREYRRLFGAPPRREISSVRRGAV